jgi:hypothetical protein
VSKAYRRAGIAALAMVFLTAPVGDTSVVLTLAIALDLAVLLAIRQPRPTPRQAAAQSVVLPIGKAGGSLYLRRRTVPGLRMRHPDGVIEAQTRWRQAGAARRRNARTATARGGDQP